MSASTLAVPPSRVVHDARRDRRRRTRAVSSALAVVLTELVTNAVLHARSIVEVTLALADGTVQVLEYARRKKVVKVVFASSAAVYGDVTEFPVREGAVVSLPGFVDRLVSGKRGRGVGVDFPHDPRDRVDLAQLVSCRPCQSRRAVARSSPDASSTQKASISPARASLCAR